MGRISQAMQVKVSRNIARWYGAPKGLNRVRRRDYRRMKASVRRTGRQRLKRLLDCEVGETL